MNVEEGVRLALESLQKAEEEDQQHAWLKAKEGACLFEEARLKSDEEDLWLKYGD